MSNFVDFILRNATAKIDGGSITHFGDPETEYETARTAGSKCPLLSFGIVSIAGPDAQEFVNGQFTTNCTEITLAHSQFSGWCDPKGRVLFLFTLYTDGECIYAILPKTQIVDFMRRLQMYIMRADVQLDDVTTATAIFGSTGETGAHKSANALTLESPWGTTQSSPSTTIIRHGIGRTRFITITSDSTATEIWNAMDLPVIGEDAWTALECVGGLPRLDGKSSGQYLPQNLNLDKLDAVSFSKGCYPGQEIIARLKYRGDVKKRLMVATIEANTAPDPRTLIHTKGDQRAVGHVLFAKQMSQSQSTVSAIVETKAWDESLIIDGASRFAVHRIDLPYEVD
jgi:hypothetical protein